MYKVSWIRQLILAIGLVILGYGAFYWEYKHTPATEEREELAKHVFQIKDVQIKDVPIKSITLTNSGGSIQINCLDLAAKLCKTTDHSKWEVTEPKKLKADDGNVTSLLGALSQLSPADTIDLKKETPDKKAVLLKEYGLDPESRKKSDRIQVTTEKGDFTFYVGQAHPVGDNFFAVGNDENKIFLVSNSFKSNLGHDLTYWRDKKLSTLATHEINSFTLQSKKDKISGERKNGAWSVKKIGPEKAEKAEVPGENELIDQFLSAATQMTAKNFVSDSKSDAKAKAALVGFSPIVTLSVQKETSSEPVTFTLYEKPASTGGKSKEKPSEAKLYATVSNLDPLFEIDATLKNRVEKSLNDFRQIKLLNMMDRYSARNIEFSGQPLGPTPLTLTQVEGKWINADKSDVAQEKVQDILDKLSAGPIKDFIAEKSIPAGEQKGITLKIGDEKEKAKSRFVFWKADKKLYARDLNSTRKEAFLIDTSIQDALPWDRAFFKKQEAKPGAAPAGPSDSMPGSDDPSKRPAVLTKDGWK